MLILLHRTKGKLNARVLVLTEGTLSLTCRLHTRGGQASHRFPAGVLGTQSCVRVSDGVSMRHYLASPMLALTALSLSLQPPGTTGRGGPWRPSRDSGSLWLKAGVRRGAMMHLDLLRTEGLHTPTRQGSEPGPEPPIPGRAVSLATFHHKSGEL